jgi:hypothetical protein
VRGDGVAVRELGVVAEVEGELGVVFVGLPLFGDGRDRLHRLRVVLDKPLVERDVYPRLGLPRTHLRVERLRLRAGDVAERLPRGRFELAEILVAHVAPGATGGEDGEG